MQPEYTRKDAGPSFAKSRTMPDLFDQIRAEIPGYLGAAYGTIDGSNFQSHTTGELDLAHIRGPLAGLMTAWHQSYEGLGGAVDFGSNDEVLMSASRGFILVRMNHSKKRFVAVALKASGNLGYLRFRLRGWLKIIAEAP